MLAELARALPAALLFALPVTALGAPAPAPHAPPLGDGRDDHAGAGPARGRARRGRRGQRLHVHPAARRHPRGGRGGRRGDRARRRAARARLRPRRAVAAGGPGGGAAGRGRPPRAGGVDEPRPALPHGRDPGHGRRAGRRGRAPARRGRRLPGPDPAGDHPAGGHGRRPVPALPGDVGRACGSTSSRSRSARSSPTPSPPRPRRRRPPAWRWSRTSRTAGRPWRAATPS